MIQLVQITPNYWEMIQKMQQPKSILLKPSSYNEQSKTFCLKLTAK